MAQLDVERKSHNSMWWLWLLIVLLIVLAVWWFMWGARGGDVVTGQAESSAMVAGTSSDSVGPPAASVVGGGRAVGIFESFVRDSRADSMSIDHEHTATGLRDLAAAGEALLMSSTNSGSVATRADSLRAFADQLEQDPTTTNHADITRRAFIVGSEMLNDAGSTANSEDIAEMRSAAEAIVPATLLLEQRSAIQRYWDAAEAAVTNMGGSGS